MRNIKVDLLDKKKEEQPDFNLVLDKPMNKADIKKGRASGSLYIIGLSKEEAKQIIIKLKEALRKLEATQSQNARNKEEEM